MPCGDILRIKQFYIFEFYVSGLSSLFSLARIYGMERKKHDAVAQQQAWVAILRLNGPKYLKTKGLLYGLNCSRRRGFVFLLVYIILS